MKIIELRAENLKRLKAVEIRPDKHLQIVGGRNAQDADYQVWIERVGDADAGAVIIEDGAVA